MRLIETWLADQERAFDLFAKFPAEETGTVRRICARVA